MHVVLWLQLGTVAALVGWGALSVATITDRLRFEHARKRGHHEDVLGSRKELVRLAQVKGTNAGEWHRGGALVRLVELGDERSEELARAAIRSDDAELRYAAITALGRVAEREEWAVDLLVEALAEGRERAARIAAALERCAPQPGSRLPALLTHPSAVVRFWTVRLLARYPEHRRLVARLHRDANAQVRAAVLETLRITATGPTDPFALRLAVELLDEERPTVKYQAIQTVAELGQGPVAPLLVPLLADASWTVRCQAETALANLGAAGAAAASRALAGDSREASEGAVRVLQATGVIDEFVMKGDDELLALVFAAGDERARVTAGLRRGADQ